MTPCALAVYSSTQGKGNCAISLSAGKQKPSAQLPPAQSSRVQDQMMCLAHKSHPVLVPLGPVDTPSFLKPLSPSWPLEANRAEVLNHFESICLPRPFHRKLASFADLWFRSSAGPAEGGFLCDPIFPLHVVRGSHRQACVQECITGCMGSP